MKAAEFKKALKMAMDNTCELPGYMSKEMSVFAGCALHNERLFVTLEQVAALIRGECVNMDNNLDYEQLKETQNLSKRFDII